MSYEIWDTGTGNCIGRYATESEALRRLRSLLDHFGPGYADELEMTAEDDAGNPRGAWTGEDLLARVGVMPTRAEGSTRAAS